MKNKLILLACIAGLCIGSTAFAADDASLRVNGEIIQTDVAPVIVNDRVLVPIRAVSQALSSDVSWDSESRSVTVFDGDSLYVMWIDKEVAFKTDGVTLTGAYKMDVSPTIINDRTFVPIRSISELFGAKVDWLADERTVTVDYEDKGYEIPDGYAAELINYTDAFTQMYDAYADYAFEKKNVIKAEIELEDGGIIGLELYKDIAPLSVANFVSLAKSGAYDGKIFHRVIEDFMIQGGAYDAEGQFYESEYIYGEFLQNNCFNLIPHERGVISMARAQDPNSGSNQFFIVHKTSPHLDGMYAAFGKVYEGMEYVDEIAGCETDPSDKPTENKIIKTIRITTTESGEDIFEL